jgi:penicillin amidase
VAKRLAALAAGVAAAFVLAAVVFVLRPLPSRRGTVELRGLTAPVEVRFDGAGIPHVHAILEDDAWRVLGWLHASDRLFQMELRRRAAAGRLAELLGPEAVPLDKEARILRHRAEAEKDWEAAQERDRRALLAYADGVNAFLEEGPRPLELQALGASPEPWTPIDTLAFERTLCDGLTMAASRERAVFEDARARGIDAAVSLADASDGQTTRTAPGMREALAGLSEGGRPKPTREEAPAGSNAWALSGARTASGKPLLAGDPHLDAERPGIWYAAHLSSADGLDVAGLTLAGCPGIVIGHDGRVAWSLTMNQADDADLYLEKVRLDEGTVLDGTSWVPMTRTAETIRVKGSPDVSLEVLETRHGPILDVPGLAPGYAIATARAFAQEGVRLGMRPFLDADRARSGEELAAAWSSYRGPAVNLCWADAAGHFGLRVVGAIPRRRSGDGRFPVPGWIRDEDWDGLIPPGILPEITDPPDGFVTSANDDWSASGARLPFPGLFAAPDRAIRARQLAGALRHAAVADMRTMQADVFSPYAARVVAGLLGLKLTDPRAVRAAAVLAAWDGRAALRGPSRLFYAFLKEVREEIASPLRRGTSGAWVTWSLLDRMITGRGGEALWDDPATPLRETRASVLERALAAAIDTVEREDGRDPRRWSWGRVHELAYEHPFASILPAVVASRLRFGPVPLPGEWHTLAVAGFRLEGDGYRVVHIPSARLVIDLGDPDASRIVLPLGQSGQLFDGHARDLLGPWAAGRDVALPFHEAAVAKAAISTMRFVPAE